MATINATTIDNVRRTLFYRTNKGGVPVQLPFTLCTIDYDFQYYEPMPLERVTASGRRQRGWAGEVVYVERESAMPLPTAPMRVEQWSVFEYHGF